MNGRFLRHLTLASLLVFLSGVSCRAQSPTPEKTPEKRALPVSLIRVIANPEKFDGQRLRVIGFLYYGGGLDRAVCLYVSETDARNAVMPNCVSLELALKQDDKRLGKYVILNATFRYNTGHGLDFLSFDDVTDVQLWPPSAQK